MDKTMEKDMEQVMKKAEVLIEALPYIQKFNRKIIVVKYGGSAMSNEELQKNVIKDVTLLKLVGFKPIIVHGGGKEISRWVGKVGKEAKFINGLRVTDEETMDVVQQVLCGRVNKNLVAQLNRLGGQAIGLCGMDGQLFQAEQLDEKYGLVGKITGVNPEPVENALLSGYIPVVSTVAQGVDADTAYNINADTAAAKIASALHAQRLILMTNIQGLLKDKDDPTSLIPLIDMEEAEGMIGSGIISGGMIPKIECCITALKNNVSKVIIMDGRIPHSVLMELFTDTGAGTMIVKKKKAEKDTANKNDERTDD